MSYEIQDDEDGTQWTSFNDSYKEKLIKDWKKNKKPSCQEFLDKTNIDKDSKLYQSLFKLAQKVDNQGVC